MTPFLQLFLGGGGGEVDVAKIMLPPLWVRRLRFKCASQVYVRKRMTKKFQMPQFESGGVLFFAKPKFCGGPSSSLGRGNGEEGDCRSISLGMELRDKESDWRRGERREEQEQEEERRRFPLPNSFEDAAVK